MDLGGGSEDRIREYKYFDYTICDLFIFAKSHFPPEYIKDFLCSGKEKNKATVMRKT